MKNTHTIPTPPTSPQKNRLSSLLLASALTAVLAVGGVLHPTSASAADAVDVTPGIISSVPVGKSSLRDAQVTAVTTVAALPATGSGLYTSAQVRSGDKGAYAVQARTYPSGNVQLSIKRINGTGKKLTQTTVSSFATLPQKIKPGQELTLTLQAQGESKVSLSATAKIGSSAAVAVSATDSSAARLPASGKGAVTFYTPQGSPAVKTTVSSSSLVWVGNQPSATPTPTPTPTPTTAPKPVQTTAPKPATSTAPTQPNPATPAASYPSASTTGVPKGVKLKVHEGDLVISTPNTVVDGLEVRGIIDVKAPGVVIKNSRIVGGVTPRSIGLVSNINSGLAFTIQDSEIYAASPNPAWNGIVGSNFTAVRVNVHHVVDPIRVLGDDVIVRDSWLHDNSHWEKDPLRGGTPSHDDSVQIEGGASILLEGNRMEGANNAAVQITQNSSIAPLGSITIRDNYLQGGGCTINVGSSASNNSPVISGNVFGPERIYEGCAIVAPQSSAPILSANLWEVGLKALTRFTVG